MPIRDAGMMEYRQLTREPAAARALLYLFPGGSAMKDRRGYTLIEMVIVLAIVAIMATVATTNFFTWQQHYSAVGFQREFLSQCNLAKTRAMSFTRQYRLKIDVTNDNVILQQGNAGTGSANWTDVGQVIAGAKGAGINDVVCVPTVTLPAVFALIFNPNGEVLVETDPANSATITPLTSVDVHLVGTSAADQATVRLFGWTSKARLFNGWGS
jgi:prepilin-type N-terminal cleavage/methylation domain-containing protein